jgi:hypothetical protein
MEGGDERAMAVVTVAEGVGGEGRGMARMTGKKKSRAKLPAWTDASNDSLDANSSIRTDYSGLISSR